MTANSTKSCPHGEPVNNLDLLLILESRRESAMVSIDILVSTLFPGITTRSYKRWIAHLDKNWKDKTFSVPRQDKREFIERAILILDMCLADDLLPKTRAEIYRDGRRVTQYKRDVLKAAAEKVKR